MNNFENLRSMSIDELAKFFDGNCHDDAVYWKWHDENYCKKCEPVLEYNAFHDKMCECAYCEKYGKCRLTPESESILDSKEIIKLWLEAEVEE